MEQITMRIDGEIYEKIQVRMEKNKCKTLAQCARELIELGLKVEEAAAAHDKDHREEDSLESLAHLLKTNLCWSLETRFLVKFFMENSQKFEKNELRIFVEKAKERAVIVVDDLIRQQQKAEAIEE